MIVTSQYCHFLRSTAGSKSMVCPTPSVGLFTANTTVALHAGHSCSYTPFGKQMWLGTLCSGCRHTVVRSAILRIVTFSPVAVCDSAFRLLCRLEPKPVLLIGVSAASVNQFLGFLFSCLHSCHPKTPHHPEQFSGLPSSQAIQRWTRGSVVSFLRRKASTRSRSSPQGKSIQASASNSTASCKRASAAIGIA